MNVPGRVVFLALLVGLGGIIGLPSAAAASTDVRSFEVSVLTSNTADGVVPSTPFTLPEPHGFDVLNRTSVFVLSAVYQTDSSTVTAQVVEFTFLVDGNAFGQCTWRQAGGTLISETSTSIHLRCSNATIEPGEHTVEIAVTVIQNGNPVEDATITLTLVQTEIVAKEEMFVLGSTFPTLGEDSSNAVLVFLVLLVISYFQRWFFTAVASVIGILEVFLLAEPFGANGFVFTFLLLVIAIVLEIFVSIRDENMPEDV